MRSNRTSTKQQEISQNVLSLVLQKTRIALNNSSTALPLLLMLLTPDLYHILNGHFGQFGSSVKPMKLNEFALLLLAQMLFSFISLQGRNFSPHTQPIKKFFLA